MNKFKFTIFVLILGFAATNLQAGRGGAVAGGLFGGYVLGTAIANANSRPVYVVNEQPSSPTVVYVNRSCSNNDTRRMNQLEDRCRRGCSRRHYSELQDLRLNCLS